MGLAAAAEASETADAEASPHVAAGLTGSEIRLRLLRQATGTRHLDRRVPLPDASVQHRGVDPPWDCLNLVVPCRGSAAGFGSDSATSIDPEAASVSCVVMCLTSQPAASRERTTTVHMKVMEIGSLPGPPGPWNGILETSLTSTATVACRSGSVTGPEEPQPQVSVAVPDKPGFVACAPLVLQDGSRA